MSEDPTSLHQPACSAGKQASGTTSTYIVPVAESLSKEDKMVLYAVLQDIANEIRRIDREHKKDN